MKEPHRLKVPNLFQYLILFVETVIVNITRFCLYNTFNFIFQIYTASSKNKIIITDILTVLTRSIKK